MTKTAKKHKKPTKSKTAKDKSLVKQLMANIDGTLNKEFTDLKYLSLLKSLSREHTRVKWANEFVKYKTEKFVAKSLSSLVHYSKTIQRPSPIYTGVLLIEGAGIVLKDSRFLFVPYGNRIALIYVDRDRRRFFTGELKAFMYLRGEESLPTDMRKWPTPLRTSWKKGVWELKSKFSHKPSKRCIKLLSRLTEYRKVNYLPSKAQYTAEYKKYQTEKNTTIDLNYSKNN